MTHDTTTVLLTRREAARRLGCAPRTLDRWVASDADLAAAITATPGGQRRYRADAIEAFIRARSAS